MSDENNTNLEKLKREIVLARLKQASPNLSISFGSQGDFLKRDELIEHVESNTEIGKKIIKIQLEYLKAFKKGI